MTASDGSGIGNGTNGGAAGPRVRSRAVAGPPPRDPLYTLVQAKVRDFVLEEHLVPGDRLPPERDLAKRLGVSRTSVRQALAVLRVEGLIHVRHGDGIYLARAADDIVPPITAELTAAHPELPALNEVRAALEAQAAGWAAPRRTDEDLAALVNALHTMEQEIGDRGTGVAGDRKFHTAVLVAAKNSVLEGILNAIADGSATIATASLAREGQPERSLAAHRLIFDAIITRDADLAHRLMFDHLTLTGEIAESVGGQ